MGTHPSLTLPSFHRAPKMSLLSKTISTTCFCRAFECSIFFRSINPLVPLSAVSLKRHIHQFSSTSLGLDFACSTWTSRPFLLLSWRVDTFRICFQHCLQSAHAPSQLTNILNSLGGRKSVSFLDTSDSGKQVSSQLSILSRWSTTLPFTIFGVYVLKRKRMLFIYLFFSTHDVSL